MPATELIRLVETLGAPYGLERSVKITPGTLADDRCLISVGRADLGQAPADTVLRMARILDVPAGFAGRLSASLEHADVIHFGFEGGPGGDVYKIYFEYGSDARRAMAGRTPTPTLVHLAYKWAPRSADGLTVTRYTWVPCRTRGELETKLDDLVPAREAPIGHGCVFDLLSRITAYANSGELLLMEVEEPGNLRRSCDLNVYDAQLRVHQIADLIETATAAFAVPRARFATAFSGVSDQALGHLSAGLGRDGREFVTIYFGVEPH